MNGGVKSNRTMLMQSVCSAYLSDVSQRTVSLIPETYRSAMKRSQ